jgi:uncharacterized repeat protein (TIGR03803 family)
MTKLRVCIFLLFCAAALSAGAQTIRTLVNFDGTNGSYPYRGLVQAAQGNFYGTTYQGGANGFGSVFAITAESTFITLHSFDGADGSGPLAVLVQVSNGDLYGTTTGGGTTGCGTIFRMTPHGDLDTLHNFVGDPTDGCLPYAGLVQASNGNFYGTTVAGGPHNDGVIFEITAGGTLTILHSFDETDGDGPEAPLVEGGDGYLYGATCQGGSGEAGTIFKIALGGKLTTLYNLDSSGDIVYPCAGLVQGNNGNFYGATYTGGASGNGVIFQFAAGGALSTLYTFDGSNGSAPYGPLVQGSDGNFYGTTSAGGANGDGTVFRITPSGALTTLFNFDGVDGSFASTALQATNGSFYGTTVNGGGSSNCDGGCGTLFRLGIGLGPFVEEQPPSATAGAEVIILGNSLTGSTAVSFNGAAAAFTVVSDTEITTTVPAGATTGFVIVTTPSGTLKSNKPFRVIP